MSKSRAVVLTPFDAVGKRVQDTVRRALVDIGIEVIRLDDIRPGASWINAVSDAIRNSDFSIFDLSRHNPNVYYELGYAHSLRKPTILIISIEAKKPIPSDLQGYLYITYDPSDLSGLRDRITHVALQHIRRGGDDE